MITNWGAHHLDIAHWAMGQSLGGPLAIDAHAEFITNDLCTVHGAYHVEMLYPNAVLVILDDKFETGLRFEGDEGWIFCTRSEETNTEGNPGSDENGDPAAAIARQQAVDSFAAGWQRRALGAEPDSSWKLARKYCRQPTAHRAG